MRKLLLFTLVCLALVSGFDVASAQRRAGARRQGAAAAPAPKVLRMAVDARDGQLLGSFNGRAWTDAVNTMPLVKEGETFRLYTLTGPAGTGTIGKPVPPEYPCDDNVAVALSPQPPEGEPPVFAVNGDWDAQPRLPKVQDTNQEEYRNVVSTHLRGAGLTRSDVKILQLLRVDLDGDGTEEVLISANSTETPGHFMGRGDFSVVLLRKVVRGRAVTIPIVSEVELKNHEDPIQTGSWHHKETVAAVLDLNGDGVMEVITTLQSIWDTGKSVYEVKGPKPRNVLGWYCSGGH